MKSPITPLEGWVVVQPIEEDETKLPSGIIMGNLSSAEKEKRKNKGIVIETPKDCPVAKGCTVYFKSYAGVDCYLPSDTKKYLLIEYQDLVGVLKA